MNHLPPSEIPSFAQRSREAVLTEKRARPPRPPPPPELMKRIRIAREAHNAILATIGRYPAETGGALLGDPKTFIVHRFVFDEAAFRRRQAAVYQPDTAFLNAVIEQSSPMEFLGIVHSHPPRYCRPSGPDEDAAWSNMTSPSNPHLSAYLMPIVQSAADVGRTSIHPYVVICDPRGDGRVIVHSCNFELWKGDDR